MTWIRPVVLLVTATAIACAPAATGGKARNHNVLTSEEIAASQATTAHDAIKNLRPMFLRSRGQTTLEGTGQSAHVFLDGQKYGDIETLKTMSVQTVREIRFLSASDATTKYGTGYTAGIIEVWTR